MAVSQSNQRVAIPSSPPSAICPKVTGFANSPLSCSIRQARDLYIEEIPASTTEK